MLNKILNVNGSPDFNKNYRSALSAGNKIITKSAEAKEKIAINDAAHSIYLCRRFLKLVGVWIEPCLSFWHILLRNLSTIVCFSCIGLSIVTISRVPFRSLKSTMPMLAFTGRVLYLFMTITKYSFLRTSQQDIEDCMKRIELDWLSLECKASRDIMVQQFRFGHLITKICAGIAYSAVLFLTILLAIIEHLSNPHNHHNIMGNETVSMQKSSVSSHFVIAMFPKFPIDEILNAIRVISGLMVHTIAIACYSLEVVMVMHACGQLKILMGKLNELVDGGEMSLSNSIDGRLSDIIKHHVKTSEFVSRTEKMFRGIGLIDLGGYTIQLCCVAYLCLLVFGAEVKKPMAICTWVTVLLTFVYNIFSFCYIGELLAQEYMKVGEIAYMIEWYRLPAKQRLDLKLIVIMSRRPVTLTAGGVIQMSIKCFASVIRTSYGYLSMLRTVMD